MEARRTTPAFVAGLADDLCRPTDRVRVEVGVPDGHGWVSFAELAAPEEIDLARARIEEERGVRRKTAAMWLATFVTTAAVAPVVRLHRRSGLLLDVPFTSLRVHRDPGRAYDAVAVPPDAPVREAAAEERAAHIGTVLATDMAPLVEELRRRARTARRALWGSVADGLAAEYLAHAGPGEERASDFTAVLDAASPPLKSRPQLSPPARAVCCNAHRGTPGRCSTCPDLKPAERLERQGAELRGVFGEGGEAD